MKRSNALALPFLLALLATPGPAVAQSVRASEGGTVAVAARGVPLGQLLREISSLTPLEVTWTDAALAQRPVDVVLDGVPLGQAAARTLLETGLSFAVGGLAGGPLRVFVGASAAEVMAAQQAAAAASDEAPARSALAIGSGPSVPSASVPAVEGGPAGGPVGLPASEPGSVGSGQGGAPADLSPSEPEGPPAPVMPEPVYVPANGQTPGYTMNGESVTFDDPSFVPYKNTEAARRARQTIDVSKIP